MTALFNNLKTQIDKYLSDCNKKIYILNDGQENDSTKKLTKEYKKNIEKSSMISDYSNACMVILWFNGKKKYDYEIMKLLNEYVEKGKTFILIVPKDFDFNYIVNKTIAKSIDAISWLKDNDDQKDDQYLIVVRKY